MPRVIGIDPGSGSYDVCGLEDGKVFLDASIPTVEVAESPDRLLEIVKKCGRLDAAIVPSGYGLPLKRVADLSENDFFYLSLTKPEDHVRVPELRVSYERILNSIREIGLHAYVLPGVVHLDTVPKYRKVNRIDMGTPDKLCSAALALHDQASRLKIDYKDSSFILLEMGFAYTASLAIEAGHVVDGIGGTSGPPGFLAMGGMDGELAYLLGGFSKDLLFEGGVASIAGTPDLTVERLLEDSAENERLQMALDCYLEGLRRCVLTLKGSVKDPKEILLSGRLSHTQGLARRVAEVLGDQGEMRVVQGMTVKSKESAQGAALLADGIAGGRWSKLLEIMRIQHASGTVLDQIYLENFKETHLAKYLSKGN